MDSHHDPGAHGFTGSDLRRLQRALAEATDLRVFRRVQVVLRVAEGTPVEAAARWAGTSRRSVHRWVAAYLATRCVQDLADAPRTGRPREADDLEEELLDEVMAQDPRTLGYGATTWTVPLLATHLKEECACPVSARTLRRRLHECGWRWKRPRYVFAERDPRVGHKKGRSAIA